jgi:hypothetical protein
MIIGGTSIWLNEFVLGTAKTGIYMLFYYIPIVAIYLICKCIIAVTKRIKSREKDFTIKFNKSTIFLIFSIFLSIMLLKAFYYPQLVIPDKYSFDSFSIQRVSINDEGKQEELRSILNDYKCKRSLTNGISYNQLKPIEIDITVFDYNGNAQPMHIVIEDKQHMRYSSGNTDFFYIIEDKDNTLRTRIIKFADSL